MIKVINVTQLMVSTKIKVLLGHFLKNMSNTFQNSKVTKESIGVFSHFHPKYFITKMVQNGLKSILNILNVLKPNLYHV